MACTGTPTSDGGTREHDAHVAPADGARRCERLADSDNGIYCDGVEACVDAICVPGAPPCGPAEVCRESDRRCDAGDCELDGGDADGDGHRRPSCGGDDCDDADANRYPGNAEICDDGGHDEDCDDSTFGATDTDGDGHLDAACCNGASCADDCDDTNGNAHPGAPELCNEADDDCDGSVDEGLPLVTCWPDADDDGWGRDAGSVTACRCGAGYVTASGDCHDAHPDVHPDADYHATPFSMPPTFHESWDYDCDGVEELRWTDGSMIGCFGAPPACSIDEGWASMPARIGCGLPAQVVECASDCSTRVVTRPQECR